MWWRMKSSTNFLLITHNNTQTYHLAHYFHYNVYIMSNTVLSNIIAPLKVLLGATTHSSSMIEQHYTVLLKMDSSSFSSLRHYMNIPHAPAVFLASLPIDRSNAPLKNSPHLFWSWSLLHTKQAECAEWPNIGIYYSTLCDHIANHMLLTHLCTFDSDCAAEVLQSYCVLRIKAWRE